MADKRISELTPATSVAGADLLVLLQGGDNKKVTIATTFGGIKTPMNFNPDNTDIDAVFSGTVEDNLLVVDASANKVGIKTATPSQDFTVNGSLGVTGILVQNSTDTQTSTGPTSIITSTTIYDMASAQSATLANGVDGQIKTVVSKNIGPVVLTPANFAGYTIITFDAVGDSVTLKFITDKWYVISSNAVLLA